MGSGIPFLRGIYRETGKERKHSHCRKEGQPLEEGSAETQAAAENEGMVGELPRGDAELPQVGVDQRLLRRRRRAAALRPRLHRQVRREPLPHRLRLRLHRYSLASSRPSSWIDPCKPRLAASSY